MNLLRRVLRFLARPINGNLPSDRALRRKMVDAHTYRTAGED